MAKIYRTFKNGKLDGQTSLKEISGLSDTEIQSMLNMAWMFYSQGKLETAEVILNGVAAIDPDCAQVHSALGALYCRQGKNEEALEKLEIAEKLDPSDITVFVNRGDVLFKMGRVEEAARDFKRALEMDPDCKDPAANRARLILVGLAEIQKMAKDQK